MKKSKSILCFYAFIYLFPLSLFAGQEVGVTVIQNYPYGSPSYPYPYQNPYQNPYQYQTDQSTPLPDQEIKRIVQRMILDNPNYMYVNSRVFNSTVTLSGTVGRESDRRVLENSVKSISGVRTIINKIDVYMTPVIPQPLEEQYYYQQNDYNYNNQADENYYNSQPNVDPYRVKTYDNQPNNIQPNNNLYNDSSEINSSVRPYNSSTGVKSYNNQPNNNLYNDPPGVNSFRSRPAAPKTESVQQPAVPKVKEPPVPQVQPTSNQQNYVF